MPQVDAALQTKAASRTKARATPGRMQAGRRGGAEGRAKGGLRSPHSRLRLLLPFTTLKAAANNNKYNGKQRHYYLPSFLLTSPQVSRPIPLTSIKSSHLRFKRGIHQDSEGNERKMKRGKFNGGKNTLCKLKVMATTNKKGVIPRNLHVKWTNLSTRTRLHVLASFSISPLSFTYIRCRYRYMSKSKPRSWRSLPFAQCPYFNHA